MLKSFQKILVRSKCAESIRTGGRQLENVIPGAIFEEIDGQDYMVS